jgi:hypothetical protein
MKTQFTLDLVPYDVTVKEGETTFHGVKNTILGKLAVPRRWEDTHNGGSIVDEDGNSVYFPIDYDPDTEECVFGTDNLDHIEQWIYEKWNAIEEIGWEALMNVYD